MAPRLSRQTSKFGVVCLLYPSIFWELRDKRNFKKIAILTRKPRSQNIDISNVAYLKTNFAPVSLGRVAHAYGFQEILIWWENHER